MKTKACIYVTILIILLFVGIYRTGETLVLNNEDFEGLDIQLTYLGDFEKQEYEPMPGEEVVQIPTVISSWPGNFYQPPDKILIKAKISNLSDKIIKNIPLTIEMKFKIGYLDESPEESIEQSYWEEESHIVKTVDVESLLPNSSMELRLYEFNLFDLFDEYEEKGLRPWACQTIVKYEYFHELTEVSKVIPIELIWD